MKPKDEQPTMVARNDQPRNVFRTQKPDPNDADQLAKEVSEEEQEMAAVLEGIAQRQAQLQEKKLKAEEAIRQDKLNQRAALLDDAADWREIARSSPDANRAKDFLRKAKDAEAEATRLGAELNLNEPAPAQPKEAKLTRLISTDKAIGVVIALFLFFVMITYIVGSPLEADPMNAIGQSIMKNAPIRALLSFTLTFLTFLVSVFFIRVAFPQFYRIWHNRIDTERSLDTLINEAPAWVVLASLLALFYMFMQLFASFYQALYA
jgi:hypothetical protein